MATTDRALLEGLVVIHTNDNDVQWLWPLFRECGMAGMMLLLIIPQEVLIKAP